MARVRNIAARLAGLSILDALDEPGLAAPFEILSPGSLGAPFWRPSSACLWNDAAAELFRQCTGRAAIPMAAFQFIWLVIGRRGGKSFVMAVIAVYLAIFKDWRKYLSPGERAVILLVAADREDLD